MIRGSPRGRACDAVVAALLPLMLAACGPSVDALDPRALPFRLEVQRATPSNVVAADVDGDGRDELAHFYTFNAPPRHSSQPRHDAIVLLTPRGEAIDQLNYQGTILQPRFIDLDRDGVLEIVVPLLRNDTLLLSVADARMRKQYAFFMQTAGPRVDVDSRFPWTPGIEGMYATDVDRDGTNELVTILNASRPPIPRSVLVHDLPSGELIGRASVGAAIRGGILDDFDGDGVPELLTASFTPNNHMAGGGFDDRHSYLILFRLAPTVEVAWARELGGLGSNATLFYEDLDGNGRREVLLFVSSSNRADPARFEVIEAGTRRVLRRRTLTERFAGAAIGDVSGDPRPEILLLSNPAEPPARLLALDGSLEIVSRRDFPVQDACCLRAVGDLDADGRTDFAAFAAHGTLVIGADLRLKAARRESVRMNGPPERLPSPVRRGPGVPPDLLSMLGPEHIVLRMVPNTFAWFWAWGRWGLFAAGLAALLASMLGLAAAHRRARLHRTVHTLALDPAPHGLLLLRREGRVEWTNAALRRWLGEPGVGRSKVRPVEEVLRDAPEVLAFCRDVLLADPRHVETEGTYRFGRTVRELRLIAEPVRSGVRPGRYWLVRVEDRAGEVELREARAWALLAQRVAHDFRKPLAGIVHELHRMRREYLRTAPAAAAVLEPYTAEIEQRVLGLRARADELLQVVGAEEPRAQVSDLNEFVQKTAAALQARLPDDVRLNLHLSADAPHVRIDRRLMESVLMNLVANGVDAMPEGGTIAVSTNFVRNARLNRGAGPVDYGRIEVLDAGHGISDEVRARLFEPGFTTRDGGWGLGLVAARRLIESHCGFIDVQSEPGHGAAVTVYLPAVRVAHPVGAGAP